jgi:tripartite-type tricarboxylate transporter receptor subunit TctC
MALCFRLMLTAAALTGISFAVAVPGAKSQEYPERAIRVVVPFAPAGTTDIVTRILFDRIAKSVGQPIVVDNRPGAGGNIAVDQVAKSVPDGYTLIVADPSSSLPANVTLFPNLTFNPARDLAPVALFGVTGAALIVTNSMPANSLKEFVALAKSKPGELLYGSTGNGSPGHLNGARLSRVLDIKTAHVPYRIGSQGTTDLLTGRIHFWVAPIPTRLEQVKAGQLRVLATAGSQRSDDLPTVPTVKESGFGDFDASTAYAVFAPVGTPKAAIERLHGEVTAAIQDETVRSKLRAAGVEPRLLGPMEVRNMLEVQIVSWAEVVKSAKIRVDGQ